MAIPVVKKTGTFNSTVISCNLSLLVLAATLIPAFFGWIQVLAFLFIFARPRRAYAVWTFAFHAFTPVAGAMLVDAYDGFLNIRV